MRNKLSKLIDEFMIKNCRKPNVIILGREEYRECFLDGSFDYFDVEDKTFEGIEVIQSTRKTYLKVGHVE